MKHFNPGLVLVDIVQQDVVNQLKNNEETRNIPLILMTGYTIRQRVSDLPVDDIIEKPFNLGLLEKKIEKLIAKTKTMAVVYSRIFLLIHELHSF